MTTKHTAEPWETRLGPCNKGLVFISGVKDTGEGRKRYGYVATTDFGIEREENRANAARIVACVNACEGINPKAVPKMLATCKDSKAICDNILLNIREARQLKILTPNQMQGLLEIAEKLLTGVSTANEAAIAKARST